MVCEEMQERLSEYLDGALPIETMTRMDDHLSACAGCRRELESLKSMVRELNTLRPVAPPDDFLEQLHARMTPWPWHQRLIRFLFLPLRFKIPFQVVGALTAALLIFSILTLQQEEKDQRLSPSVSLAPSPGTPSPETRTMSKRPAPDQAPSAPALGGSKPEAEKIPEEQKKVPGETLMADETKGMGTMAENQTVLALALRVPAGRLSADQNRAPREVAPSEGARLTSKKGGFVDPLFQELKTLAARHQGKMLAAVYEKGSGKLHSVEIEIPSSQFGAFHEGLKNLGDVEPSPSVSEADRGSLKVGIRVIE